jgi:peptidoglycan/LPS O-acetylase OafA/YrhL
MFRLLSDFPDQATQAFRRNNFDALRLLFASMVFLFHVAVLTALPSFSWLQRYVSAGFAVQAFFVVSGFLVSMSYERSDSLSGYFSKRLRRIAPAYVVVVVVCAVALVTVSTYSAAEYFAHPQFWRYLGYNLVLANFGEPTPPGVFEHHLYPAVNGSLWTIKIEMAFYIVLPLIVLAARRFGWGLVIGGLFAASLAWKLGLNVAGVYWHQDFLVRLAKQLPGQVAFFMGGAWTYWQLKNGRLPSMALALLGVVFYAATDGMLHDLVAPFAVTAIVSWAALAAPTLPAVGTFGDFSYGLYLVHFPIVQVLIAVGLFARNPWIGLAANCALVAMASVLSWYLVESPWLVVRGARKGSVGGQV